MIRVSVFDSADAAGVVAQAGQATDWPDNAGPHLARMAAAGSAFTLRNEGKVLCIAGVLRMHAQAGTAWTIMAPGCWGHMGRIGHMFRDYLDTLDYRRIDMLVRAEFAAGHRWARRLGFTHEAVLHAWAPDGGDMVMHARIRENGHG